LGALYREVGRRIKDRRLAARMSQERLAAAANLSRASISNIEAGRQQVYLHHLVAIADALKADLHSLLSHTRTTSLTRELQQLDNEAHDFVSAAVKEISK